MKVIPAIFLMLLLSMGCNQDRNPRGIPGPDEVDALKPDTTVLDLEKQMEVLQEKGFQTFVYEGEGQKQLMQQYYLVFLKSGENRNQDSLEAAKLQKEHLAHLNRMADEGFLSLAGPFGDDGSIRGIAVYNTPTREMADSLAKLDPMVKAGRLVVEIHPWWAAKGSKLK